MYLCSRESERSCNCVLGKVSGHVFVCYGK